MTLLCKAVTTLYWRDSPRLYVPCGKFQSNRYINKTRFLIKSKQIRNKPSMYINFLIVFVLKMVESVWKLYWYTLIQVTSIGIWILIINHKSFKKLFLNNRLFLMFHVFLSNRYRSIRVYAFRSIEHTVIVWFGLMCNNELVS